MVDTAVGLLGARVCADASSGTPPDQGSMSTVSLRHLDPATTQIVTDVTCACGFTCFRQSGGLA